MHETHQNHGGSPPHKNPSFLHRYHKYILGGTPPDSWGGERPQIHGGNPQTVGDFFWEAASHGEDTPHGEHPPHGGDAPHGEDPSHGGAHPMADSIFWRGGGPIRWVIL